MEPECLKIVQNPFKSRDEELGHRSKLNPNQTKIKSSKPKKTRKNAKNARISSSKVIEATEINLNGDRPPEDDTKETDIQNQGSVNGTSTKNRKKIEILRGTNALSSLRKYSKEIVAPLQNKKGKSRKKKISRVNLAKHKLVSNKGSIQNYDEKSETHKSHGKSTMRRIHRKKSSSASSTNDGDKTLDKSSLFLTNEKIVHDVSNFVQKNFKQIEDPKFKLNGHPDLKILEYSLEIKKDGTIGKEKAIIGDLLPPCSSAESLDAVHCSSSVDHDAMHVSNLYEGSRTRNMNPDVVESTQNVVGSYKAQSKTKKAINQINASKSLKRHMVSETISGDYKSKQKNFISRKEIEYNIHGTFLMNSVSVENKAGLMPSNSKSSGPRKNAKVRLKHVKLQVGEKMKRRVEKPENLGYPLDTALPLGINRHSLKGNGKQSKPSKSKGAPRLRLEHLLSGVNGDKELKTALAQVVASENDNLQHWTEDPKTPKTGDSYSMNKRVSRKRLSANELQNKYYSRHPTPEPTGKHVKNSEQKSRVYLVKRRTRIKTLASHEANDNKISQHPTPTGEMEVENRNVAAASKTELGQESSLGIPSIVGCHKVEDKYEHGKTPLTEANCTDARTIDDHPALLSIALDSSDSCTNVENTNCDTDTVTDRPSVDTSGHTKDTDPTRKYNLGAKITSTGVPTEIPPGIPPNKENNHYRHSSIIVRASMSKTNHLRSRENHHRDVKDLQQVKNYFDHVHDSDRSRSVSSYNHCVKMSTKTQNIYLHSKDALDYTM